MNKIVLITLATLLLFSGCAKLSLSEVKSAQEKIDLMAERTIKALIKENPSIKDELSKAKGYAVINWKVTKIPVVGAGGGNGVIVDLRNNERTYINVSRFDIGGGWGVRSYKNLVITQDEKLLDEAKDGDVKFEAGAEVSAGTVAAGGGSEKLNKTITTHVLVDGGGSATATFRVMYSSVDSDLN